MAPVHGYKVKLSASSIVYGVIWQSQEYVYKIGDHGIPNNYRNNTVVLCIGQLFESILNNRLSFKNEVCNYNDTYQAGFKSNTRTTDNILILCANID